MKILWLDEIVGFETFIAAAISFTDIPNDRDVTIRHFCSLLRRFYFTPLRVDVAFAFGLTPLTMLVPDSRKDA